MSETQKADRTPRVITGMLEKEAKRRPDLIASLVLRWLEEDGTVHNQKETPDKIREPLMKKPKSK